MAQPGFPPELRGAHLVLSSGTRHAPAFFGPVAVSEGYGVACRRDHLRDPASGASDPASLPVRRANCRSLLRCLEHPHPTTCQRHLDGVTRAGASCLVDVGCIVLQAMSDALDYRKVMAGIQGRRVGETQLGQWEIACALNVRPEARERCQVWFLRGAACRARIRGSLTACAARLFPPVCRLVILLPATRFRWSARYLEPK